LERRETTRPNLPYYGRRRLKRRHWPAGKYAHEFTCAEPDAIKSPADLHSRPRQFRSPMVALLDERAKLPALFHWSAGPTGPSELR
jgi:hypothetical protein